MHAVLITFKSEAPLAELENPFTEYAEAMRSIAGLVFKTWLHDGQVLGGFHVFDTEAAARTYLGSEMVAGLTANPAFSNFEIAHYGVVDGLSRLTGSPEALLVEPA
jgi:hypothetical protein